MYNISIKIIKKYPFRIQCVIWLYLHGWIYSGLDDWYNKYRVFFVYLSCPDVKVKIVKEDKIER